MIRLRWCPALLLVLVSCFKPGGGGSVHHPPESIRPGVETPLQLELSAVHKLGLMDRRMTKITCHYRLAGSPTFTALAMTCANIDEQNLVATATLPAFPKDAKGPVQYYFDFHFDGVYNQRESPSAPNTVPLR